MQCVLYSILHAVMDVVLLPGDLMSVNTCELMYTMAGPSIWQVRQYVCRICGNLAMRNAVVKPSSDASRRISNLVGSLILLKETLELLPGLGQPLEGAESELLQAVGANCNHEVFQTLLETATQVLDEVRGHKGTGHNNLCCKHVCVTLVAVALTAYVWKAATHCAYAGPPSGH